MLFHGFQCAANDLFRNQRTRAVMDQHILGILRQGFQTVVYRVLTLASARHDSFDKPPHAVLGQNGLHILHLICSGYDYRACAETRERGDGAHNGRNAAQRQKDFV